MILKNKTRRYYDLHLNVDSLGTKENLSHFIDTVKTLSWGGISLVMTFSPKERKSFQEFSEIVTDLKNKEKEKLDITIGAEIKNDIKKNSRIALKYSDIIIVFGGMENTNRTASEAWEVDILAHPEKEAGMDYMDQKNSGMNHIIGKFMGERKIALELNFSEVLNSYGVVRGQILGRMKQNILIARKYKIPIILSSGARDIYSLRAPRELISFGKNIGLTENEARDALVKNPLGILKKSRDRKNPNILLSGLEVINWGKIKKVDKKMYGWY